MSLLSRRGLILTVTGLTTLASVASRTPLAVRLSPAASRLELWLLETGRSRLPADTFAQIQHICRE